MESPARPEPTRVLAIHMPSGVVRVVPDVPSIRNYLFDPARRRYRDSMLRALDEFFENEVVRGTAFATTAAWAAHSTAGNRTEVDMVTVLNHNANLRLRGDIDALLAAKAYALGLCAPGECADAGEWHRILSDPDRAIVTGTGVSGAHDGYETVESRLGSA